MAGDFLIDMVCSPAAEFSYLSPAPQALPQAAGFSSGLSPAPQALPQAAGFSSGLSAAPQAVPQADDLSAFHSNKFDNAIFSSIYLFSEINLIIDYRKTGQKEKYALFYD